ncbi:MULTISPECIES: type II secretion system protein [Dictyoglomus]|jgi:prepilin-type N-terminal cleavage/methylation domain-containing protein|uniref:Prepilin-type N-terminal cleavage/methylation domain protein n=1 Tax=Dictyoglomus turgidum (strain DSM 6724 / Z-1310) TaxID=515635 RepID=B8E2V2_DICTD|nr:MULTISPECIES: prepilin-type N-terminal cleavage/methylation domain-containing protein [Dictyoglomus]ACK42452.1 prepilin-type N-terminal cleavage/methylation domain protein [Dictyoglomus turgidum DSM 6724]PNV80320.1 MAG: prepilin-type cleavage/methylation domain-containing protein [Dictyoglomus turgidum]HBU32092.1 prepilin-type cleavage/methylation domain-containing protein [Dictyoglomus sp.]
MRKGLTFLEVLIAVLLLGIIMSSVGVAISYILRADEYENMMNICLYLTEKKLEEYRKAVLANWNISFTYSGNFANIGYTDFFYSLTVFNTTYSLKQIFLQVWKEENNNNKLDDFEPETIIITYISRRN